MKKNHRSFNPPIIVVILAALHHEVQASCCLLMFGFTDKEFDTKTTGTRTCPRRMPYGRGITECELNATQSDACFLEQNTAPDSPDEYGVVIDGSFPLVVTADVGGVCCNMRESTGNGGTPLPCDPGEVLFLRDTMYIFAYGVHNKPRPENATNVQLVKKESPICMGARKDGQGNPTVHAEVIFNRNIFTGGIVGTVDAVARENLRQLFVKAYEDNYKEIKLVTHSNGVLTAHSAWPLAVGDISRSGHTIRSPKCPAMTVDMLHLQAAVSEYVDLFSPIESSVWQARKDEPLRTLVAEVTSVEFLFNSEDEMTWDPQGLSTVGRREVVPWILDNQRVGDVAIRGQASIACADDENEDGSFGHSTADSLMNCPPRNLELYPYPPGDKSECHYSTNPAHWLADDEWTPEGIVYQIW